MAITYPLSTPTTIGYDTITLRAVNSVGVTESPFSFRQQVVKHAGERWEADVSIAPGKSDLLEEWIAFVVSLKGQFGTFLLGDPNMQTARGSASTTPGTPVVSGAGQTGDELNVSGLPISATGYLLPGDYIQLGAASTATLHKVLVQVNSDGGGLATIDIWPSIITAPADAAAVTVANTKGRFRMKDRMTDWSISNSNSYGLKFTAVGVVP